MDITLTYVGNGNINTNILSLDQNSFMLFSIISTSLFSQLNSPY